MKIRNALALLGVLALASSPLCADLLTTKDGRQLEGKVVSEAKGVIRFQTSVGVVAVKRADVQTLVLGKTRVEELAEREKAAKSAEEVFEVARWAEENGLKSQAKRLMKQVLKSAPDHRGANEYFGRVLHEGEWLEPEERDRRVLAKQAAEMSAQGRVLHGDRWVTPAEKAHLEKGDEFLDGAWIPFDAAQRRRGLELHAGTWMPRAEALARDDVAAAMAIANTPFFVVVGPDAVIAGPQDAAFLARIQDGLVRGRAWFDESFASPPGLQLLGGRMAEFYLFESDDAYARATPHFASLTPTVSDAWSEAAQKTHGFLWWDPYALSSARRWKRDEADLVGHCYHHWGHLLANRLGYDGKLLPPWFDEGIAATLEHRVHGRNDVFCRGTRKDPRPSGPSTGGGKSPPKPGTKVGRDGSVGRGVAPFDPKAMQDGEWLAALRAGLDSVPPFDDLASLEFDELEAPDIAAAMAIVRWIESRGPDALRRFHAELRRRAPAAPQRVLGSSAERLLCYDAAFRAASELGVAEADAAWRAWTAKH